MKRRKIKKYKTEKVLPYIGLIVLIVFTIYQHSTGLSWDFISYLKNAQYYIGKSKYYEVYRAPLTSFLLLIFYLICKSWVVSEYIYIIFVDVLFFFSVKHFCKSFKLNFNYFFILMLTPFLINEGVAVGTELLSLSFLILYLSFLNRTNELSLLFLSLAILTRYTNLSFLVLSILFLLRKKFLKFLIGLALFILPFIPWFIYNYHLKGSIIASISDSYALNVKYRNYMKVPIKVEHFLLPLSYYPFLLIPFLLKYKKIKMKKIINIKNLLIASFFILQVISFLRVPWKEARYLFNLVLPSSYVLALVLKKKEAITSIFIVNVIIALIFFNKLKDKNIYEEIVDKIKEVKKEKCMIYSNAWTYLQYYNLQAIPFPSKNEVNDTINKGGIMVILYNVHEPSYSSNKTFLRKFPIIYESNNYIILGRKNLCESIYEWNKSYIERLNELGINESYCKVILPRFICEKIKWI